MSVPLAASYSPCLLSENVVKQTKECLFRNSTGFGRSLSKGNTFFVTALLSAQRCRRAAERTSAERRRRKELLRWSRRCSSHFSGSPGQLGLEDTWKRARETMVTATEVQYLERTFSRYTVYIQIPRSRENQAAKIWRFWSSMNTVLSVGAVLGTIPAAVLVLSRTNTSEQKRPRTGKRRIVDWTGWSYNELFPVEKSQ